MSRANVRAGSVSTRSLASSTKILASAHSCALRAQEALEGMSGVSDLFPLAAAGVGLVGSYITGLMVDRSLARPVSGMCPCAAVSRA